MAENGQRSKDQPPLVDKILQLGKPAFDPEATEDARNNSLQELNALLER